VFWSLRIETEEARAEDVAAEALALGATGAEVQDRETGAAAGQALVKAYFTRRETAEETQGVLGGALSELQDADWAEDWKRHHKPIEVSARLWVVPSWLKGSAPGGALELVIDPQMAFGTGSHQTTFLCLQAVEAFLAAHPGAPVLDVGAGTGLLAIAAARLGAARVVGTDNDPVALRTAAKNAELNGVGGRIEWTAEAPGRIAGRFGLVVANILANTLVELAPQIAPRTGGDLALSGVLVPQVPEVRAAYEAQGLKHVATVPRDEWALVRLARLPGAW
jgi:ribosomal protein L11 methyltransferase